MNKPETIADAAELLANEVHDLLNSKYGTVHFNASVTLVKLALEKYNSFREPQEPTLIGGAA